MRLFYYKDGLGNFGDDLNPLIWYSLYPQLFQDFEDERVILGIGTLINDRAPEDCEIFVLGSGVGYHGSAKIHKRWSFEFVRGPRSAQALGLSSERVICDPGILVSRVFSHHSRTSTNGKIAFMPHHASSRFANWREVCDLLGIVYLDPADDISSTIHRIGCAKYLITEAMHGAIVADALRVPWVPVVAYPHILPFKWHDWCESIGLLYNPSPVPELWDMEQYFEGSVVIKSRIKRVLMRAGLSGKGWTPPLVASNKTAAMPRVISALEGIIANPPLVLSDDKMLFQRLDELDVAILSFGRRMGLI